MLTVACTSFNEQNERATYLTLVIYCGKSMVIADPYGGAKFTHNGTAVQPRRARMRCRVSATLQDFQELGTGGYVKDAMSSRVFP